MRTTVDINEPLLRRARVVAIETGRTLGEVVFDALRVALDWSTSPHHAGARAWLDALRERPFSVADEAILGFIRIVTNTRVFVTPARVGEASSRIGVRRSAFGSTLGR